MNFFFPPHHAAAARAHLGHWVEAGMEAELTEATRRHNEAARTTVLLHAACQSLAERVVRLQSENSCVGRTAGCPASRRDSCTECGAGIFKISLHPRAPGKLSHFSQPHLHTLLPSARSAQARGPFCYMLTRLGHCPILLYPAPATKHDQRCNARLCCGAQAVQPVHAVLQRPPRGNAYAASRGAAVAHRDWYMKRPHCATRRKPWES